MTSIREARGADFSRVYPLLLEFKNPNLTQDHWQQLFVDHSGLQDDRFGWMLLDGDQVVGFMATTFSERIFRGARHRLCNMSNWIVKNEHRGQSLALFAKVLAAPDMAVTNLSPTPQVLKVCEKMGFTVMDKSERILLPTLTLRTLHGGAKLLLRPSEIEGALSGENLRIFRDHQLPYNRHALLRAQEGDCYLMMNRSPKNVPGGLRLPFARVHHVSAPAIFARHVEEFVVRVLASLRAVAMIVDERVLCGRVPRCSFTRPGGKHQAAFRSKTLTPDDIDGLYTEAVLLNY